MAHILQKVGEAHQRIVRIEPTTVRIGQIKLRFSNIATRVAQISNNHSIDNIYCVVVQVEVVVIVWPVGQ